MGRSHGPDQLEHYVDELDGRRIPYLTLPYGQGCWGGLETAENARPHGHARCSLRCRVGKLSQSTKLGPVWTASSWECLGAEWEQSGSNWEEARLVPKSIVGPVLGRPGGPTSLLRAGGAGGFGDNHLPAPPPLPPNSLRPTPTGKIATNTYPSPLGTDPVDPVPFRLPFDVLSTSTDSEASPPEEHIWGRLVARTTQNNSTNAQSYDTVPIAKSGPDLAQICIHASYRPGSNSTTPSSSSPYTPFSQTLVNSSPEEDEMEDEDIAPKLEELEDELADIKPTDEEIVVDTDPLSALTNGNIPRKRGRPRKHPIPPTTGAGARIAKGRSKTGCITCRRRKKKCDETKPACQNCQKNAVVCEGYPPKEIWKSGRQRATEAASRRQSLVELPANLPFLIDGIETDTDRRFLDHFATNFSRVLTMVNDDTNPFKEILLPMATQNRGLMHSLMCLSGSHLSSKISDNEIIQRKHWHFNHALSDLRQSLPVNPQTGGHQFDQVDDSTIASTVALCLRTICEGETNGEYRTHMNAARLLLDHTPTNDSPFRNFITEFLEYHEVSSRISNITPTGSNPSSLRLPDFVPPIHAGAMLGVFDGLFRYISQITDLRDKIRQRLDSGAEPAVDYNCLAEAVQIDSHIREWKPSQVPQSTDWVAAQLYRQSTWVYLYRTIQPSKSSPKISRVVDGGLEYLNQLPKDSGPQSVMLMPLFLLGCAAFEPQQREIVTGGFEALREYSGLGNIRHARHIVEKVWERMDWRVEESWDWERIIGEMGYDFLVT